MHRQPTRSKWRRFGSLPTRFERHLSIAADFNMEPDQLWETGWVQSLGQRASIVAPEVGHTCSSGRGRIIDFAVISDTVQPFWRESHLSTIRHANHILVFVCTLRPLPHRSA